MANEPTIEVMDKAIALFDGLKPRFVEYPDKALNRWEVDKGGYWRPMQYHTSWDWLMPVVEKISKIKMLNADNTESTDPQEVCYPRTFGMPTEDGKRVMFRFNGFICHEADTLIEAAHKACYEVAYYEINQQKQKDGRKTE